MNSPNERASSSIGFLALGHTREILKRRQASRTERGEDLPSERPCTVTAGVFVPVDAVAPRRGLVPLGGAARRRRLAHQQPHDIGELLEAVERQRLNGLAEECPRPRYA